MIIFFGNAGHGLKYVFEIFKGPEPVFFCRLNYGVDY